MQFSPDGRILATGSEDTSIKLWDATKPPASGWTAYATPEPRGRGFSIWSLAFRPDGKVLAYGTSGKKFPGIGLVDVPKGKIITAFAPGSEVNSVAFSPDGRSLASGSYNGMVRLWDVDRVLKNAGK